MSPPMCTGAVDAAGDGGGGGGAHELVQAPKGRLPKFSETPITPPMLAVNEHPKLAVEPTIKMPPNITLPNNNLPNLGDPRTNITGPLSNGTGSGAGLGSGDGGGIGSGSGAGYGPGEGGGYGGGLYVWDLGGKLDKPTFSGKLKVFGAYCVAFAPDGKSLITGHDKPAKDNVKILITPITK